MPTLSAEQVKWLKSADAALACDHGLDAKAHAKMCRLSEYAVGCLIEILNELGHATEFRGDRHFYRRGTLPLFRSTPLPETRGRPPKATEAMITEMIAMRERGHTYQEIGRKVGMSTDAIRKILVKRLEPARG